MNARLPPSRWKVAFAMGALYFVWGSTYLAIRVAVESMPPTILASTRFLVAGAVMLALALARREPLPKSGVEWRNAALVGVILLLFGNGLVCWAEKSVPSGLTALIICTTPLWLLSMESLVPGGERITRRDVASLAIGLAGVALLVRPELTAGPAANASGILALLVAALSWAVGSTIGRHGRMPASVGMVSAIEMLAGGAALGVAGWFSGAWGDIALDRIPLAGWAAWLYLVLGGSLLAFSAYNWLLANVRPTLVATYAYVNPVVAVALGVTFLGETLTPDALAGAAVTLVSVVLVTTRPKTPLPPPSAPRVEPQGDLAPCSES